MQQTGRPATGTYGSLFRIGENARVADDDDIEGDGAAATAGLLAKSSKQTIIHKNARSLGSRVDHWLRSDLSGRDLVSIMGDDTDQTKGRSDSGRVGGGGSGSSRRGWGRSSQIFGPTDRSVESKVKDSNRAGMQYGSVDRGLVDMTIWHKRKVSLIKRRRKTTRGGRPSKLATRVESIEEEQMDDGYKFDGQAVSRLQSERWFSDQIIIMMIGICMAITGLTVSKTAETILDKKLEMALERFKHHGLMSGMALHVGVSALLAFGAFLPVAFRPVSAGSGIAEAKATLNGVIIPNCTSLLTALCKGLSVIMCVSASLPAGLEGPMIHLGLCIGENANRLVPAKYEVLDPLRSNRSRIDYAAIGTAAGVAAAFRAPISGVLFAMEEGASYWSTHLTWRSFLAACVCVITMYGIISATHSHSFYITSMDLFNGLRDDQDQETVIPAGFVPRFQLREYGLFVLVGCGGGLIGALFCIANRAIAVARRRVAMSMMVKGLEVLAVAVIYASLIWFLPSLPFLSKCSSVDNIQMSEVYFHQFDCPKGQYNQLATLLLNIGGNGITLLFQEDGVDAFSVTTCLAAGLVQLISLCVVFGLSVSAGIFIPLLFIGACFGRAFGLLAGLDPRTYAIVGAAACLGGVVRVLISLTAIVTSTTSLSFFMTPIMVTTLSAQAVGNYVSGRPGIYDVILQLRDVPFLEERCPVAASHANIRARNIMQTNLVTLSSQIKVATLVEILKEYSFSEFPVVDQDANGRGGGALVGSISRVHLFALLSRRDTFFAEGEESDALTFSDLDRAQHQLPLDGKKTIGQHLSPEDEKKMIHLSPYIQIGPHTFDGHGSAERAWDMFRALGLRSLYVVSKNFRPIGVITRHELILLEEIGHDYHEIEKKAKETMIYTRMSDLKNQFE